MIAHARFPGYLWASVSCEYAGHVCEADFVRSQSKREAPMKSTVVVLAIAIAAFIMGCQDNGNILSPSPIEASQRAELTKRDLCQRILLAGLLHMPGQFNEFAELDGFVEYATTIIPRDPIPPNPQFTVSIDMLVNGNLRPWGSNGPVWHFSGTQQNEVEPIDGETAFLTTRYWVTDLNVWFVLMLRLTETSIEIDQMRLELPKVIRAADTN